MIIAPDITTSRLILRRWCDDDAVAMEQLLSDPYVAICIMCDASTPEKSRAAAKRRINWFNSYWESGYGVRAVAIKDPALGTPGEIIGWCGVAGYGGSQGEPEILYGLRRDYWGKGLATEASRAALDDFFATTDQASLCAIIFEQLNINSVLLAERLGLTRQRRIAFADFSPGEELRRQTLDYALWCVGCRQAHADPELMRSAAAKAGLLVGSGVGRPDDAREILRREAPNADMLKKLEAAFDGTLNDPTCPYLSLSRK